MDDFEEEELNDYVLEHFEQEADRPINDIPTIKYFFKTYANSMGGMDNKAAAAFKQFESHEKLRRLQRELGTIKESQVSPRIMHQIIGKKRAAKHRSYEHWAELMLLWIVQAKI